MTPTTLPAMGPLGRLGAFAARRARTVLIVTGVVAALAVPAAATVSERLSAGGFTDPEAPSSHAAGMLGARFGAGVPNLVFLAETRGPGGVDDPAVRRDGAALTRRVGAAASGIPVRSYWTAGDPALRSRDGRIAMVTVQLPGDEDARQDAARRIVPAVIGTDGATTGRLGALTLAAGGSEQVAAEALDISRRDLRRSELLAMAPTLVLLTVVFGGLLAGALPLLVSGLAIGGTLAVLRVVAEFTPVSLYAVNLTTALGLGLAIDYGLIFLSRYREETAAGRDRTEAIAITADTAGRTILFSAITVALSLSAMLVFPLYFLRSFAWSGIAVVAFAALASLVVLPALVAVLGDRIRVLPRRAHRRRAARGHLWRGLAERVMRRPWPVALGTTVLLLGLAAPFAKVSFGLIDDRVLPRSAPAHAVAETVRARFDTRETAATSVVLHGLDPRKDRRERARLAAYARDLSQVPGVRGVRGAAGTFSAGRLVAASPAGDASRFADAAGTWLAVDSAVEPYSGRGSELVAALHDVPSPAAVSIGGPAAQLSDTRAALADRLPWALLIVAASGFLILFLFTGSVLLPFKALLLSLLSLGASFGALVHVFQEGHLRWLVGDFTVTGMTDMTIPVLMFCVAFGLSMDYEFFLLSRIKERYDLTGDNTEAVVSGLQHTGRLITLAAVTMAVVFTAFAVSGLTILKLLGAGLALTILIDATLVRGLLMPAFMRLAGGANWWAPRPLRRLHARAGLREEPVADGRLSA